MVVPSLLNGIYPLLNTNIPNVFPTLVTNVPILVTNVLTLVTNVLILVTNVLTLVTNVLTLVTTVLTDTYNYSVMKRKRREEAIALLIKLFQLHIKKTLFQSWKKETEESCKAKQFFLNRGRGEHDNENEAWCWPEGEDPISLFPRDVSIKVHINLL